jgi:hypothetical protein
VRVEFTRHVIPSPGDYEETIADNSGFVEGDGTRARARAAYEKVIADNASSARISACPWRIANQAATGVWKRP